MKFGDFFLILFYLVIAVINKLNEKYLLTKQEKYEKLIDEINKFSNSNYSDPQQELENFTKLLDKLKELKMNKNIEFFFAISTWN